MPKSIPTPSILDELESLGAPYGRRRWRSHGGRRLYEWDSLHGEVEVYNGRGEHLGALDPVTGDPVKNAVPGRTIDV
ncbi:MAG TPA: colicin E3/pyocin S6 family cytotoxin [Phenylobacterium sp.]|uniref:colicin E3/pyocin S6 family cytotoxin n=1 Tax=Phenylobacterium sp. TaxID=1871053 RepID=UPI002CAE8278|nr:colicin E3/pyocin S6 family cytotoxin [Phenylobacterium sp.]HXA40009.1 colicin E3/pyocin S6 family cytotoxin [Phenylobacterium sp.]